MITLKSAREISYMREAGRIVALTLQELGKQVKAGITTGELDRFAEEFLRRTGAEPAFLGYQGFPASICASVNEEVIHGIPGLRKLEIGDIISIDIGSVIHGYYGDASMTFPVGEVSTEAAKLMQVTEQSLYQGIEQATPGHRIGDISAAVQHYVESHGYQVVRDFVGHGIGSHMHEEPQVPNYGKTGLGPRLQPGMVIAIEPMVSVGTYEVALQSNGWTAVTKDQSLSAHFEHTVLITEGVPEILTRL
ncbi:MAG: type I methionyl aminopeptidase [Thermacetogeniaceae bacterium]